MSSVHISLTAETIFTLNNFFPVSNSIFTTWLVMLLITLLSIYISFKISKIPGYIQLIAELVVGGLHDFFEEILAEKNKIYFPYLATLFIYIILLNWTGLLPGVGTIGFFKNGKETVEITKVYAASKNNIEEESKHLSFIPLFRAGTADLNTTLSLAILTVFYIQIAGFQTLGNHYLKKFINFSNPINFFVGLLEIVSEVSRIISFAFRLFGNIFAGEVLLTVISFIMPVIAPIPFLGLELFVGFIQALVFPMLSAVFLAAAIEKVEH